MQGFVYEPKKLKDHNQQSGKEQLNESMKPNNKATLVLEAFPASMFQEKQKLPRKMATN